MSRPRFLLPDTAGETAAGTQSSWRQAYGCATPLVIAEYWQKHRVPILAIAPGVVAAESLETQLHFFCPDEARIALLPDLETLPYDSFSPHADLTARRLSVLADLLAGQVDICVVAMPTLSLGATIMPANWPPANTSSIWLYCNAASNWPSKISVS